MSKLNRGYSTARLGEWVEFRFSNFRATEVPVVSDRLLISIISVDTGKSIAKSSRAAVLDGICQWPDSILEPIWFSQDEVSKEFQECQYKIGVAMGSTKMTILGVVFLNLTNYLSSVDSTDITLPLKWCNSGTILQFKIQCLGTKSKLSGVKSRNKLSPHLEDYSPTNDDIDRKSEGSHCMPNNNACSLPESTSGDATKGEDASSYTWHSSVGHVDESSKDHIGTMEEKIEELSGEQNMWELSFRKMKIELETIKNECADKSRIQDELAMELSALQSERDSLKQDIEELKSALAGVTTVQTIANSPKSMDVGDLQMEVKDDVQFLKESNANLLNQLNKTQKANLELVSILQELEETIEFQRAELSNISQENYVVDSEISKNERIAQGNVEWARMLSVREGEISMLREKLEHVLSVENVDGPRSDAIYHQLKKENDFLKIKIQELEKDCSELTDENLDLVYTLKEVSEVGKVENICVSNSDESMGDLHKITTVKVKYLETKCADLELKLVNLRSEFRELKEKFQKSQVELNERNLELSGLTKTLFCTQHNEDQQCQSKIQMLESRLAEALEENKLYKDQLKSPMQAESSGSGDGKKNSDEKFARLETDLRDMQERLLHMSMQYAEVAAQREKLVMELKNATAKKGRWFL